MLIEIASNEVVRFFKGTAKIQKDGFVPIQQYIQQCVLQFVFNVADRQRTDTYGAFGRGKS